MRMISNIHGIFLIPLFCLIFFLGAYSNGYTELKYNDLEVSLNLRIDAPTTINMGDGSPPKQLSPSNNIQTIKHTFKQAGKYVVTIKSSKDGLPLSMERTINVGQTKNHTVNAFLKNNYKKSPNTQENRVMKAAPSNQMHVTQREENSPINNIENSDNASINSTEQAMLSNSSSLPHTISADASLADLNNDCILNDEDVNLFGELFRVKANRVNYNQDETWDLADITLFITSYNLGDGAPICDDVVPVLEPGNGFSPDLPDTEFVGNNTMEGYSAQAIARWDVVPYQTFDQMFEIGIVAFHKNGIDRVEFSLDNGPWTTVSTPTLNPRTGVVEYVAKLDPTIINDADGEEEDRMVEVRAVVYPHGAGETRVLAGAYEKESGIDPDNSRWSKGHFSLFLYSNADSSFDPIKLYVDPTLTNGGGDGSRGNAFSTIRQAWEQIIAENISDRPSEIILTQPGEYALTVPRNGRFDTTRHWITIRPDSGIEPRAISLRSGVNSSMNYPQDRNIISEEPLTIRPHINMLRFYGISVDQSYTPKFPGALLYNDNNITWWDHMHIFQSGSWADADAGTFMRNVAGIKYITHSETNDVLNCFLGAEIVRDSKCSRISGDVFSTSRLIVNNHTNHVDGSVLDFHTDLFQEYAGSCTGDVENRIAYGNVFENVINAQNVLYNCASGGFQDMAFVNIFVENIKDAPVLNQPDPTDHLVLLNFGNPGVGWRFRSGRHNDLDRSEGMLQKNLLVQNNVFTDMAFQDDRPYLPETMDVTHNHLIRGSEVFIKGMTTGTIYPAKNQERGAYAFGGPALTAIQTPGLNLHNHKLLSYDGEILPRGPLSIFEPCLQSADPVALIAANPLQIGLGKGIISADTVDFYGNASHGCSSELVSYKWYIDNQLVSTEENVTLPFEASNTEIKVIPFTVNIPPLFERNGEGRCVALEYRDDSLLSKLFVTNTSDLTEGQLITLSSPQRMPGPMSDSVTYEVAEIHNDHIRIRVMGAQNIMQIKQEPFQCRENSESFRQELNSRTYYINTITLESQTVKLEVTDSAGLKNVNTRHINIANTTEPGLLLHYSFDLPEATNDNSVIDISGRKNHALWNEHAGAHYDNGTNGRSARFGSQFAVHVNDSIQAARINIPAEIIFGLDQFTISFQMKKDSENEVANSLLYRHPNMLNVDTLEDGRIQVNFKVFDEITGETQDISLFANTASTEWQDIMITYDGSKAKLYVDGSMQDSQSGLTGKLRVENNYMGWALTLGAEPWLGGSTIETRTFNGRIDEFKIYNRAIDSD